MSNRLAASTSPYLRQHADNPVDWQPWDAAALGQARAEGKPILLSIGYSACHWCHVMAHESFEDPATAQVMNALYVNIKLDREERPDLDKVYQLAHQALTGRGGGWPLTVFLTPDDLMPFYAGTYFPNQPRHGLPNFTYVLEQVRDFWDTRRDEVRKQNGALAEFLADAGGRSADAVPGVEVLDRAQYAYARAFDPQSGGQRGAPKFPHCGEMEFLLDRVRAGGVDADSAASMAEATLTAMATRGLYDHLGGGFFRYCVDAKWEIPHFEKMLYDNAQLLPLYARAAKELGLARYADVVAGTVAWMDREMTAPGGAVYGTLDADSEGEEGRFYVWQRDEVRDLLGADDFAVAERRYGLDRPPNFEGHAWHLVLNEDTAEIARLLDLEPEIAQQHVERSRKILFDERATRVRPGLDDKILTAWNALLAAGLLRAGHALGVPEYTNRASAILDFVYKNLWIEGRLFACHAGGRAQFPAYLDDHAFLLDALLESLQTQWNARDFDWARHLAEALLRRFRDAERGAFYFTAHDHETLPHRPRPFLDESLPSGNGVAARALLRLGHLLGEAEYLEAAAATLRAAAPTLADHPQACASLLRALDAYWHPAAHVVVRAHDGTEAQRWRDALADSAADAYVIPPDAELPGLLGAMRYRDGGLAYLCRGTACEAPIGDAQELAARLRSPAI